MLKKLFLGCAAILLSAPAWAESYTYLTNSTDKTLTINTTHNGGMVKGSHWWQHATVVPPFGTVKFLELNRDTGVTTGKTFNFDTTVTAPDGSTVLLQQRLTGTLFFSNMLHGTGSSAWHDDRSRYVDNYTFDSGPVNVAYKAVGARANGDDYYYVIHPEQSYPERAASNNFKVMAYNVWALLPGVVSKSVSERLGQLPAEINGYDAIVFSELFDNSRRETFLSAIESEYPHQTTVVDESGSIEDGGVLIVSRWPIETSSHTVFDECVLEDCISAKGVKYARINKNGNKYHVFGTHTQAWSDAEHQAARASQFQTLRSFMDGKNIPSSEPVIIAGDLNVDKNDYPAEYNAMLSTLNATEVAVSGYQFTADGDRNGWHDNEAEILDYVLYSNSHIAPITSSAKVLHPRSIADDVFQKYDLSDHFPVAADMTFNTPAVPSLPSGGFTKAIQNKWGCGSDARCDDYLTFSGSDAVIHATDKVMWQFTPVADVPGEYNIRSKWGCGSGEARCDDWLTFGGTDASISSTDKIAWKLEPVSGQADSYYIRSRYNCGSGDSRCDHYLTFSGSDAVIHATDKVVWKLVP